MVFGVNECRVCGKPITPTSGDALVAYQKSLKGRITMPEAAWRKAGYKAMPMQEQMTYPKLGCCLECGVIQIRKIGRPVLGYIVIAICALGLLGIWAALSFMTTQ